VTDSPLARARRAWERLDATDLSLRLTLAALLLRPVGDWRFRPAFLLLAAAGLVLPGLQRRAALWLALAALAALRVVEDWPLPDNHAYLLAYWCLAAGIALRSDAPARALTLNGRLLIGLVFLAASLWKVALSPDYLSGDFMRFTWITDERFAAAAAVIGGMDADLRDANRDFLADAPGSGPALVEPPAFVWATHISSAWTAAIEVAVALAFLLPAPRRLRRHRDAALVLFCVTTFAFAPVAGFAWLLLAMGIAQSDRDRPGVRAVYLATFALVLVYHYVPWLELLARWAGRL
jgi:hypothetical protein